MALIPRRVGMTVFDPAMGEGALLAAAERHLGSATTILGADIDRSVVSGLSRTSPHWKVSAADATRAASRRSSSAWRQARLSVDAIVMNPPFSFRGYGGLLIQYGGSQFRATPAMAFVATALAELTPTDGLYAVLPRGSVDGARDRQLWAEITKDFEPEVHAELPRGTFPAAAATSLIVSIRPRALPPKNVREPEDGPELASGGRPYCTCVEVVRGRTAASVGTAAASGLVPWLHTRELRDGKAAFKLVDLPITLATIGPFVTLPRVGRFDSGKIAIVRRGAVVLSDCLFALRMPAGNLEDLRNDLLRIRNELADQYFGTGAPHLTLERVIRLLATHGYRARHVKAGAEPSGCWCDASRYDLSRPIAI